MRSVGLHSTSGREKEGKKERTKRVRFASIPDRCFSNKDYHMNLEIIMYVFQFFFTVLVLLRDTLLYYCSTSIYSK